MTWELLVYLVPYLIALAISLGVGLYAWQRRTFAPALSFALFTLVGAGYTAAYLMEVVSPGVDAKVFWDNVQLLAICVVPLGFLSFALQYTNIRIPQARRFWLVVGSVLLAGVALAFTDALHGGLRTAIHIEPFEQLVYTFTPLYFLFAIYAYMVTLVVGMRVPGVWFANT